MTEKDFVNGCDRDGNPMKPFQLALHSSGPQVAFATQFQDKFFKVRRDPGAENYGDVGFDPSYFNTLHLIPFPPFTQSRARNPTTPTNKAGVFSFHEKSVSTNCNDV